MSGKQKLIDSMSNLIQHVSLSGKKQQEIFATLSPEDLRKMLSNFDDENENVRKITLILLAEFLYLNESTQRRFCDITETPEFQGKIVLSSKFPKSVLNDPLALKQIFQILKPSPNQDPDRDQQGNTHLFWYIDTRSENKALEKAKKNNFSVDPLHCIVGVWVNSISKVVKAKKQGIQTQGTLQQQEKVPTRPKIKLSSSLNYEKESPLLIPETPTKSTLTEQPIVAANPIYSTNIAEGYKTPIRVKPNINFMSKTEPMVMNSVQFPVKNLQSPPQVKAYNFNTNVYINCYPHTAASYQSTPNSSNIIYSNGTLETNPRNNYGERQGDWRIGIQATNSQGYARQDNRRA